jgi:condensin complex subunit 1
MQHWFGAAEAALAVLFRHGAAPEEACAAVVRHIAAQTLGESPTGGASPLALARLCFVLGHSALKLLVYSEDLASRLKRAKGGGAKQQVKDNAAAAAAAASAASASSKPAAAAAAGRKKAQKKKQAAADSDADNSGDEVSVSSRMY